VLNGLYVPAPIIWYVSSLGSKNQLWFSYKFVFVDFSIDDLLNNIKETAEWCSHDIRRVDNIGQQQSHLP